MLLFPAIDLRQGRCVRLRQGDPAAETVYGEDPAAMARHWVDAGAPWLHVVNLDGALGDHDLAELALDNEPSELNLEMLPINLRCLRAIRQAVTTPIQFGGGIRRVQDVALALSLGAARVVLGTVAVREPQIVWEALRRFGPERIAIGIDARNGQVATHGWTQTSSVDALALAKTMATMGVTRIIYTDIGRDGMQTGVNVDATADLARGSGLRVIASGGVQGIDDIAALKAHERDGVEGVIVGQALYTGALDLRAALAAANPP